MGKEATTGAAIETRTIRKLQVRLRKTSAAMSQALSAAAEDEDAGPDPEDTVNEALAKRIKTRKMLTNASYFAFTATPKNKTLEMFGEALPLDAEGKVKHRRFTATP